MAKAEQRRSARLEEEVTVEELVERARRFGLVHCDDLARELRFEHVAEHRRRLHELARAPREALDLVCDHRRDRRRHVLGIAAVERRRARAGVERADELLQVERIATAVPVDARGRGAGDLWR